MYFLFLLWGMMLLLQLESQMCDVQVRQTSFEFARNVMAIYMVIGQGVGKKKKSSSGHNLNPAVTESERKMDTSMNWIWPTGMMSIPFPRLPKWSWPQTLKTFPFE